MVVVDTSIDSKRQPGPMPAWFALTLVALFLGLLSFAAARSIRIECHDVYLTTDDGRILLTDQGERLTTGQQECRLVY